MALRGKSPDLVEKRLKALFYGMAGAGKTMASISFPKPYLIDTERGAENSEYTELLKKKGGVIFQSSDFDEVTREVFALNTEKHDYKTLIIDPMTVIYNQLLDQSERKVGSDFGRHYQDANKKVKHLLNLLMRLDMNVIITSHAKNEYGDKMIVMGQTFDCYKKLDYLFDLVFEIQKRGNDRIGIVRKSRLKTFEDGQAFKWSYEEVATRYGKDILERDAIPEVLATDEQVTELKRYIELLKVPEDATAKWLEKAQADTFKEMKFDDVQRCITKLKSKIEGNNDEV